MTYLDMDPLSIHTIVMAATGVLTDIADKRGMVSVMEQYIRPAKLKEFRRAIRKNSNFFKHADRDANAKLEHFNTSINDFALLEATYLYSELGNEATVPMKIYLGWFIALYPEFTYDTPMIRRFQQSFVWPGGLPVSREEVCQAAISALGGIEKIVLT